MAKVPFSKFGAKPNTESIKCTYITSKGEEVEYEIIKYLPYVNKLLLVSNIVNQSIDDNGYYNPMRVKMYTFLEVIYTYTNISFTDKMKEDPFKLYDSINNTNIFTNILETIGDSEWKEIVNGVSEVIKNIYDYKNSILGILDAVSTDYSDLNLDAKAIQEALGDPNNLTLLKDVMTKLG